MIGRPWKFTIKTLSGVQDIVIYAATSTIAKDMAKLQFGNTVVRGPITMSNNIKEDGAVPTNAVSDGKIAGIGVGSQGEPGVNKKKKSKTIIGDMLRRRMQR